MTDSRARPQPQNTQLFFIAEALANYGHALVMPDLDPGELEFIASELLAASRMIEREADRRNADIW